MSLKLRHKVPVVLGASVAIAIGGSVGAFALADQGGGTGSGNSLPIDDNHRSVPGVVALTPVPTTTRPAEPGDDRGLHASGEPGDDRGGRTSSPVGPATTRTSEPGDDRGSHGTEPGDDHGGHGAEPGDDHRGGDSSGDNGRHGSDGGSGHN